MAGKIKMTQMDTMSIILASSMGASVRHIADNNGVCTSTVRTVLKKYKEDYCLGTATELLKEKEDNRRRHGSQLDTEELTLIAGLHLLDPKRYTLQNLANMLNLQPNTIGPAMRNRGLI